MWKSAANVGFLIYRFSLEILKYLTTKLEAQKTHSSSDIGAK